MPVRGGKRSGAGRPKGAANKATADIKEAAGEYSDAALKVLVRVMGDSTAPAAAQVAAANAILDRAHGKPKQSLDVDANGLGPVSITYVTNGQPAPAGSSDEDYETS
ncbi:hypothetical protein [Caulobacter sp. RHG1]|uniref:hypothetical protein n=1 Tax=Caulobacter sp. (strain RHG1) TaxID=2545762 RepID=UPI0015558310|nr:hypothetical protein [Caulobacter sp. RHG1]NQE62942.1 hypothetical protein [Caulobacter sp. RHG1]